MNFIDSLIQKSREKNSVLTVGLDPDLNYFPEFLKSNIQNGSYPEIENTIFNFNRAVIDSVSDIALAVKPQLAYYEIYGSNGIRALEKTIEYAKSKDLFVINDAKRGDIGSTSEAYAEAHLGHGPISADMVTVNPFLGSDGYRPFIHKAEKNNKAFFILLKTSNPSSSELQDQNLEGGKKVYQKMAEIFIELTKNTRGDSGYSFIGFVAGATHPEIAKEIRSLLPHSVFLVPGLGFQGGKAEDLKPFFDSDGNGALVSSSRDITYAYMQKKENWQGISESEMKQIIREKAQSDCREINRHRME